MNARISLAWSLVLSFVAMAGAAYLPAPWWQWSFAFLGVTTGALVASFEFLGLKKFNDFRWLRVVIWSATALALSMGLDVLLPEVKRPPTDPFVTTPPPFFDWKAVLVAHLPVAPALAALWDIASYGLHLVHDDLDWQFAVYGVSLLAVLQALTPMLRHYGLSPLWAWYWLVITAVLAGVYFLQRRAR